MFELARWAAGWAGRLILSQRACQYVSSIAILLTGREPEGVFGFPLDTLRFGSGDA
jgi:hypothetical protein